MAELQQELVTKQYKNAANLNARIALHQRFSTNSYGWQRWVFGQLDLPPDAEILELGCGPANLWTENRARIPDGWQITLSDASPGMIETAQTHLKHVTRPFRFEVIDAQSIPFEDMCFNAVIANHMLYHVPDKSKVFSEICRVLKPDGRMYATTVGQHHMRELDELVSRFLRDPSPWAGTTANSFLLENGSQQLEAWFSPVHLYRYEDALLVTDVQPLVDYVFSMRLARLMDDRRNAFVRFVQDELARTGAMRITKDSGMFEAFRGPTVGNTQDH